MCTIELAKGVVRRVTCLSGCELNATHSPIIFFLRRRFNLLVCKALFDSEDWDPDAAKKAIKDDLDREIGDAKTMHAEEFINSLFETCDVWTESCETKEYTKFLRNLYLRITRDENGFMMGGRRIFKTVIQVIAFDKVDENYEREKRSTFMDFEHRHAVSVHAKSDHELPSHEPINGMLWDISTAVPEFDRSSDDSSMVAEPSKKPPTSPTAPPASVVVEAPVPARGDSDEDSDDNDDGVADEVIGFRLASTTGLLLEKKRQKRITKVLAKRKDANETPIAKSRAVNHQSDDDRSSTHSNKDSDPGELEARSKNKDPFRLGAAGPSYEGGDHEGYAQAPRQRSRGGMMVTRVDPNKVSGFLDAGVDVEGGNYSADHRAHPRGQRATGEGCVLDA